MRIIDFLYYHVVQLITSARIRKFRMDRIPDQAAYLLTLCFLTLLFTAETIFEYICLNTFVTQISLFIFVIVGLAVYSGLRYIYINKRRYLSILEKKTVIPEISSKKGKLIAMLFLVISYFLPFLVIFLLHKINPLSIPTNWK
jgi:uncharacterized membrane protein